MALSDLAARLNDANHLKNLKLESFPDTLDVLLQALSDASPEVQQEAVRCVAIISSKIPQDKLKSTVENLLSGVAGKKSKNYLSALSLLLSNSNVQPFVNKFYTSTVFPSFLQILKQYNVAQEEFFAILCVVCDSLEIYHSNLSTLLPNNFELCIDVFQKCTTQCQRELIIKKACYLLSDVSLYGPRFAYKYIIEVLDRGLGPSTQMSEVNISIKLLNEILLSSKKEKDSSTSFISTAVADYTNKILSLLKKEEAPDELTQKLLEVLGLLLEYQQVNILKIWPELHGLLISKISYDPNLISDTNDEDDIADFLEEMSDYSSIYEDEEDVSWIVRRESLKVVLSVILSRLEYLPIVLQALGTSVVSKLNDREESVCLISIEVLKQAFLHVPRWIEVYATSNDRKRRYEGLPSDRSAISDTSIYLVSVIGKHVSKLSDKTPLSIVSELLNLVTVIFSSRDLGVQSEFSNLSSIIYRFPDFSTLDIKIKLNLVRLISAIISCGCEEIENMESKMSTILSLAVQNNYPQLSYEALITELSFCKYIHKKQPTNVSTDFSTMIDSSLQLLESKISDLKVRLALIDLVSQYVILFYEPDFDSIFLRRVLIILCKKLQEEPTRSAAARALCDIFMSVTDITKIENGTKIYEEILQDCCRHIDKSGNEFTTAYLELLEVLLKVGQKYLAESLLEHILGLLIETLKRNTENTVAILKCLLIIPLSILLKSKNLLIDTIISHLQSSTIHLNEESVCLLSRIIAVISKEEDLELIINSFTCAQKPVEEMVTLALIAAQLICIFQSKAIVTSLNKSFMSPKSEVRIKVFTTLIFGQLDYGKLTLPANEYFDTIASNLNSPNADVMKAAAIALGSLTSQSEKFIKELCALYVSDAYDKELLLISFLTFLKKSKIDYETADKIWDILSKDIENIKDFSTSPFRTLLSECLGLLICNESSSLYYKLELLSSSEASNHMLLSLSVFRFSLTLDCPKLKAYEKQFFEKAYKLFQNPDLEVSQETLQVIISVIKNRRSCIADVYNELLQGLISKSSVDSSNVHVVQMGPFQHVVDNSINQRQLVFETLYSLLDIPESLNHLTHFLQVSVMGLEDEHYIKLVSLSILEKLVDCSPSIIDEQVDTILEALRKIIELRKTEKTLKTDSDNILDLVRSALRVLFTMKLKCDNPVISEFESQVQKGPYSLEYEGIKNEIKTTIKT